MRRNLVELTPDPDDRRARVLRLTPAGRSAVDQARPGWEQAQRRIAQALGQEDNRQLTRVIDRLLSRADL